MKNGTARGPSPRGWLRWLLRMPIWVFRLRLGWLFRGRLILLTHWGRKSRMPRYAVLEVVRHDLATQTHIIASGWGEQAQWLKNIEHTPNVLLHTGREQFEALAARLPVDEAARELHAYAQQHPKAFRSLSRMMLGQELHASWDDCATLAWSVPVVAVRRR